MGLIKIRIFTAFYIYLLTSVSAAYTLGEFPTIRPVPCQNRMTGESGVCTYNWSCKNVAHGVHVGYCVDRFFVGSCCKTPDIGGFGGGGSNFSISTTSSPSANTNSSADSSSYGTAEATKEKYSQVESLGEISDATPEWTVQERVKTLVPTRGYSNYIFHSQIHNDRTSTYAINYTQTLSASASSSSSSSSSSLSSSSSSSSPSSSSLSRKPVLPDILSTTNSSNGNDFLTNAQSSNKQETRVSSRVEVPTTLQFIEKFSTPSYFPQYNSTASESFHEQTTVSENKDRNPGAQGSYWQSNATTVSESSHVMQSLFSYDTQNPHWTVPDKKGDDHQISFVIEDTIKHSSDEELHTYNANIQSDSLFTWAYTFLSNGNKNTTKAESDAPSTEITLDFPSSDISSPSNIPSHHHISGSLYEVNSNSDMSYSTEIDTETAATPADVLPLIENSVNIDKVSVNFTKFTEPHYPWPSPTPTSKEPISSTSEKVPLRDVSRVCGRSKRNIMARIVGGRKSHYLRWPWMISLRRFEGKTFKHKCGAALLNQLWAITAAHCVDGKLPNDVILRLGEYNFHRIDESHPHIERRIYMIVIHPEFDPATYENDLALLRFYEPVRFQANIVPVCLPKFIDDIAGRTAVVTGWGRLSEEGELPGSLHEVHMPILTNKECEEMYSQAGYSETIRDVFVCAGRTSGGLDACEGDSGGPMVVTGERGQWMLVGLISWGMGCAAPRQPGVYTRITKFVDWIDEIIAY